MWFPMAVRGKHTCRKNIVYIIPTAVIADIQPLYKYFLVVPPESRFSWDEYVEGEGIGEKEL